MYIYVCGVWYACVCMHVCCVCVCICVWCVYVYMYVCVVCIWICMCGCVEVCGCMSACIGLCWCLCMCSMCVCVVCAYECGGVDPPSGSQSTTSPLSFSLAPCLPLTPRVSPAYLFLVFLLHWLLWIRSRRLSCCTLPVCLLPAGGGSGLARPGGWASALVDIGTWVQVGQLLFDPLSHLFWA